MKKIFLWYAILLLMSLFSGIIIALMWRYSRWLGFLFLYIFSWIWIPFAELRKRIPVFPEFSSVLLTISCTVLSVIEISTVSLIKLESFYSIMWVSTVGIAIFITAVVAQLIPQQTTSDSKWLSQIDKIVGVKTYAGFLFRFNLTIIHLFYIINLKNIMQIIKLTV